MADGCALCHGTVGQGGRGTGPHIAPNPLPFEAFAGQVRRPADAMPAYTKSCCRADSANSLATDLRQGIQELGLAEEVKVE